ncbi:hypothetical protein ACPRNU_20980 [Chromobacterium vaccinii]|uniref:hypothetical protein n=1 Tax=Chromobacterium vaccinii TaxID=1108595 RepID=UPI003C734FFD
MNFEYNVIFCNADDAEAAQRRDQARPRAATVADAAGLARLFQLTYGDTSHPCQQESFIRDGIASGLQHWQLLEWDGGVGACACLALYPWNRSREMCFGAVHPALQQMGIVSALCRRCLDSLPPQPEELGFCTPRQPAALRAMRKFLNTVLLGHDGGPNTVDGIREHHLLGMHPPFAQPFPHAAPEAPAILASAFVRERLYAPLGLSMRSGAYPATCFTGSERGERDGAFLFGRDDAVQAVFIGGYLGEPGAEAAELERFLASRDDARYVCARVLADKTGLIAHMLRLGFEITAYLPAWHWENGLRCDCLLLAWNDFDVRPRIHGFADEVEELDRAWAELAAALLRDETARALSPADANI